VTGSYGCRPPRANRKVLLKPLYVAMHLVVWNCCSSAIQLQTCKGGGLDDRGAMCPHGGQFRRPRRVNQPGVPGKVRFGVRVRVAQMGPGRVRQRSQASCAGDSGHTAPPAPSRPAGAVVPSACRPRERCQGLRRLRPPAPAAGMNPGSLILQSYVLRLYSVTWPAHRRSGSPLRRISVCKNTLAPREPTGRSYGNDETGARAL
jgi:hypothetical protein